MAFDNAIMTVVMAIVLTMFYCAYKRLSAMRCYCPGSLIGKVAIVTSAAEGVRFETARALARRGATVVITGRCGQRCARARHAIIHDSGNHRVHSFFLDLTSFHSIYSFTTRVMRKISRLNILMNNAGCGYDANFTRDQLPVDWEVNYFGPCLLTILLFPLMSESAPSRVVTVTSNLHWYGFIKLTNFYLPGRHFLQRSFTIPSTKLALVVASTVMARRLRRSGVTFNIAQTECTPTKKYNRFVGWFATIFFHPPELAAQTIIHLCVSSKVANSTGQCFRNCKPTRMSDVASDHRFAKLLWDVTEEVILSRLNGIM